MTDDFDTFFRNQQAVNTKREAEQFIERARNAMRAVRVAIQDGDEDEALRLINEALGDDDDG